MHSNADALSRRPCRSCERQELKNTEDDSDDDVDQTNLDLKVSALTHSEAKTDTIVPESAVVLDGWQVDAIRQAQLDDKDISPIFVARESINPRPDWNKVSQGSGVLKTIWRPWNRLEVVHGLLYRRFICDDGSPGHLQFIVPASLQN